MDAARLRALAKRCRDLARCAIRDDIRRQLREWTHEFEAEAKAKEGARALSRDRKATA